MGEVKNPIVYAIADKHNEGFFYNFVKKEEDMSCPSLEHFLPTKELAEEFIADYLSDDYEIVDIELVSYRQGVTHVVYADPKAWRCEEEEEGD